MGIGKSGISLINYNDITHLLPIQRFVSFIAIFLIQIGHLWASNHRDPFLEGFERSAAPDLY